MKKLLSFLIALCLLSGLVFVSSVAVFAEDGDNVYVIDKSGLLEDYDVFKYDVVLKEMSEERNEDLLILITDGDSAASLAEEYGVEVDAESPFYLQGIAENYYDSNGRGYGEDKNGILVLMRTGEPFENNICVCTNGDMDGEFGDEDIEKLVDSAGPYLNEGNISGAVSACIDAEEQFFKAKESSVIPTEEELFAEDEGKVYFYDHAKVLSDDETGRIRDELKSLSEEFGCDVVIATSAVDMDDDSFETMYYDNRGYGTGEERDGILTVIIIDGSNTPSTMLSLCGKLAYEDTQDVKNEFDPDYKYDLNSNNYYSAIRLCIEAERRYLEKYQESLGFHPVKKGVIATLIGTVIGAISTFTMKGKLKSVTRKNQAADYVVPGSFELRDSRDLFLYSHVTKTARPQNDSRSGGGGGGFHVSSGGVSHNSTRF